MSVYLHRYKIKNTWISGLQVGCFYLNEKIVNFFKENTTKKYTKHFKISTVSAFIYDDYKEVDYIQFSQKAILGLEPIIYIEPGTKNYQTGLEMKLSEKLSSSMSKTWHDFARSLLDAKEPILEYKECGVSQLENDYIRNLLISIRIGKAFIRSKVDYKTIEKSLEGFTHTQSKTKKVTDFKEKYKEMPQRYFIYRNSGKVSLVSEPVKQKGKINRYFTCQHSIWITEKNNCYFMNLNHGTRRILLDFRNSEGKLIFYRNMHRHILFTRNGDSGESLSSLQVDKKQKNELKLLEPKSEIYSQTVGFDKPLKNFGETPEDFLYGNTRIYITYFPEDSTRLGKRAIKSGADPMGRLFEYVTYAAKLSFLEPVNDKIKTLSFEKPSFSYSGYRSLSLLEDSEQFLKEKETLKIGIVCRNPENYSANKEEIFQKLSRYFDPEMKIINKKGQEKKPPKCNAPLVRFVKIADNLYSVRKEPKGLEIFKLEVRVLNWNETVFGELNENEVSNKYLRTKELSFWLESIDKVDGLIIETDKYGNDHFVDKNDDDDDENNNLESNPKYKTEEPLDKEAEAEVKLEEDKERDEEKDPKEILRNELTRRKIINQFFYGYHDGWGDVFTQLFSNILARIGFVQSCYHNMPKKTSCFLFVDIYPAKNSEKFHLIVSKMNNSGISFLLNNQNQFIGINELFLKENIIEKISMPLNEEELKERLESFSELTKNKIWVFPIKFKDFLPNRENLILFRPKVQTATTAYEVNKEGIKSLTKSRRIFSHLPGEVFIVPDSLVTDQAAFAGVSKLDVNELFLTRTKLVLETSEELVDYTGHLYYLMYLNAQFSSATSLPYPLHVMGFIKDIMDVM